MILVSFLFIPFIFSSDPVFSFNLKLARENPDVLLSKVQTEVNLGRIEGTFPELPFSNLRVSLLGGVPKKEARKFWLIPLLSYLKGSSVNDAISKESASVSYVSFDRAVDLVRRACPVALLAKSDLESAFRLLPVHPDC